MRAVSVNVVINMNPLCNRQMIKMPNETRLVTQLQICVCLTSITNNYKMQVAVNEC